jgi:NADH-quinone oxidoreductase subunit H
LAAWAVVPFGPEVALANINAGLLFVMAITSMEVYGVIIAGWASNSKYAFLGALRASAQMVSYEIAMGFCSGGGPDGRWQHEHDRHCAGSGQRRYLPTMGLNFLSWNWLPLLPIFVVYLISGIGRNQPPPV